MKSKENPYVRFVAEIGQNHQGDINIAKKMVDVFGSFGIFAIKTAKRDIETSLTDEQKGRIYDNPNSFGHTYYEHRLALELSNDEFIELKEYTESKGLEFFSSFTDVNSLDFLVEIGVKRLKIASSRVTDYPLLFAAAATGLPVTISTGMSTMADVEKIVSIFADREKWLLQCTSCYPNSELDVNLDVIETYKNKFGERIDRYGLSGHHVGLIPDIIAACCYGATVIERHVTLSRAMKGTDHAASLEPAGVERILRYIGQAITSKGSGEKKILDCELPFIQKLRGDIGK